MDRPTDEETLRKHLSAHPVEGEVEAMRKAFEARLGPQPELAPTEIGGVPARTTGEGPLVLWFHGGGYVFGAPETHALMAERLAEAGLRVVLPVYPRAPEDRWPAMLDAACGIVDAVEGPLAVGGDSAGGHLALNLALARPGRVAALGLIAPNTDRTGKSATRDRSSDAMNDDAGDLALWRKTAEIADSDPQASPLLADLSELPPLHLEAAGDEILLDDSLLLVRGAGLRGVETTLHVTPGLFHMFPLWPDALPQGAAALDRLGAHFARHLAA
ncbi:alpha/beta hydrolase [Histidinibacterium aquaticum]|nr:alpha/beta hydrolase fold domain-containing protein [Histidinibacterium aquaticum]